MTPDALFKKTREDPNHVKGPRLIDILRDEELYFLSNRCIVIKRLDEPYYYKLFESDKDRIREHYTPAFLALQWNALISHLAKYFINDSPNMIYIIGHNEESLRAHCMDTAENPNVLSQNRKLGKRFDLTGVVSIGYQF